MQIFHPTNFVLIFIKHLFFIYVQMWCSGEHCDFSAKVLDWKFCSIVLLLMVLCDITFYCQGVRNVRITDGPVMLF